MNGWEAVCAAEDVEPAIPRLVLVGDREVALFRLPDGFYALDDKCTHGAASLSDGQIVGDQVECPFHAGRFDIRTGAACALPCTEAVASFPCKVESGQVLVSSEPRPSKPSP